MEHNYAASNFDLFENSAFLGYYAASSGNFLPTFRDNLSVPSLRVKNSNSFLKAIIKKTLFQPKNFWILDP
jgi:hypothetical protein